MQGLIFWWTGLYKGLWRFASLPDLWNIVRGGRARRASRSPSRCSSTTAWRPCRARCWSPIRWCSSFLLGAPRLLYRYWKDSRFDLMRSQPAQRVLVLGAGRAGEALLRDLARENRYRPVGLLDDNATLRGAKVHGVPVLGVLDKLPRHRRRNRRGNAAHRDAVGDQRADAPRRRTVRETGVPFRTMPRLQDVVAGRMSFSDLKEVAIEDLLGRDPVQLDWTAIRTGSPANACSSRAAAARSARNCAGRSRGSAPNR